MKLSVEAEFYDFLDSKIEKEKNLNELKNVVDDLSEESFDETDLQNHFKSLFGRAYYRSDGFVQFIYDTTDLIQSSFNIYHFRFSFENCLRVLIFEALRPFMLKSLKKTYDVENFGSRDIDVIYFYLQKANVTLNLEEHLYFTDDQSKIRKFINGLKSAVKSADKKIETSEFSKEKEVGAKNKGQTVENIEDKNEEFNLDEKESNETDEDEHHDDDWVDESNEENSGEKEAAAAFEELF